MSAATAILGCRQLAHRAERDPAAFIHWLPNQLRFLASPARCKQIRQGNQWGGKTIAALAEVIGRCVGRHPLGGQYSYPKPRPDFEAWVICDSWSQAVTIMAKLWALLPKDEIDPGTVYEPVRGFRGKNPCVRFRNGAIIRVKTANQDPKSLASGTIDVALFDEPPPSERVFTEVQARLQSRGGILILSYTPVNAPVEYLRQYVEDGKIEDFWSPLTPEALIPVGDRKPLRGPDGRLRDSSWVAELRRNVPTVQAPVVIDGEWEFRAQGAYFEGAWDPSRMVNANPPQGDVKLLLGIDHGERPGKQISHLIAVDDTHFSGHPSIYVLDEYVDFSGTALPEDDARGILAMLQRNGFEWKDLHTAMGDRVHAPGRAQQKSNRDLQAQISKILKVPRDALRPEIRTAKRGEGRGNGSVGIRSRWLFQQMVRGTFAVNPRCKRLIEALPKYTGADDDTKDPVDSIVYGCDRLVYGSWNRRPVATIRF